MSTLDFYSSVSLAELSSIIHETTLEKDDLVGFIQEVIEELCNYEDFEESYAEIVQGILFSSLYEFEEESWSGLPEDNLNYLIRELLEEKSMRSGKEAALDYASSVVNVLPRNVQRYTGEHSILSSTEIVSLFAKLKEIVAKLRKGGVPKKNLTAFVSSEYNETVKTAEDFKTELAVDEETLQKILNDIDGLAALKDRM